MSAAAFVALLLAAGVLFAPPGQAPAMSRIGHDFLPFYAAGTFVREGNPHAMYDIEQLRTREREIATANGLPLGDGFGPFWNPPFFALPFTPLSALPFRAAVLTWLGINFATLAGATALLCRVLGDAVHRDWRTWALVPLLIVVSAPFFFAVTHGQNTFCSLLILTLAVYAWRARRAWYAGLTIGLLTYKPQLAAVVALVACIELGWRAAAGAALSGGLLIAISELAMPGILETYRTSLPTLLHFMQVEHVYMWERHATLKAFWRLLIQGYATGETSLLVNTLTLASAGALGASLLLAACRRGTDRDRLIAATIATMPLVMPFYFDYDLLLLAIPGVLYAAERSRGSATLSRGGARRSRGILDRAIVPVWCALYLWLVINPDVAERTHVNIAVPLLAVVAGSLIARALRRDGEMAQCVRIEPPTAAQSALTKAA